jgi:hypothetical protein
MHPLLHEFDNVNPSRCRGDVQECFVFDVPPALYLSQWYLTTLFPKRRAFRFRGFETFKEIDGELTEADIAFRAGLKNLNNTISGVSA